jgi:hypothetical protein
VRGLRPRDVLGDSIAQPEQVDPREQTLASSEQDGRDGEVQLVHEARLQVLPDRGDAAAEPHVLILGYVAGTCERFADASGDEVKRGAAAHRDGWSRMVREHEDGRVVRRVLAPPPLPRLIWPSATNRPEHIPPEYRGADASESARGEVVVDARRTPSRTVDLAISCKASCAAVAAQPPGEDFGPRLPAPAFRSPPSPMVAFGSKEKVLTKSMSTPTAEQKHRIV